MLTPAPPGAPTPASGDAGGSQPPTHPRTRVGCSPKPSPPTVGRVGAGVPDNRAMEYRSLGRTGMQVSPLCLGAMMFGAWGEPDHATCIKTIHAALDAGINFIDTAHVYSQGESEIIVGKALADGKRDDVVLATKVNVQMGVPVDSPVGTKGDPNQRGNSRRWIIREVENSLRRLNTDWIDLYQVHRPDPDTDIEETLSALTDLQRQGKIPAFGSVAFSSPQTVQGPRGSEAPWARSVCDGAAALLIVSAWHRGGRSARGRAVRHGCAAVESAGRRVAYRGLSQRSGSAGVQAPHPDAWPVRHVESGQPAQTGS